MRKGTLHLGGTRRGPKSCLVYICVCLFSFIILCGRDTGRSPLAWVSFMESIMFLHLSVDSGDWTRVTGFAQQCLYSLGLSQPRSYLAADGVCALKGGRSYTNFFKALPTWRWSRVEASEKGGQWKQGGGGQGTGSTPTLLSPSGRN